MMFELVLSLAQGLPRERSPAASVRSNTARIMPGSSAIASPRSDVRTVERRPAHARHHASQPAAALTRAARALTLVLFFAAAAGLTACKTAPRAAAGPTPSGPWETRRAALQQHDHFDLSGRIAVAAAQEGFNAKLRWKQQGAHSNLSLDGPLGVGGVKITADGSSLKVIDSHGKTLDSDAARDEMNAKLGFEPPLASLRYWVLGVPDPAHPADEVLDEQQRLASLKQDGWEIDYTDYATVAGQWRPSKLTLKRDDVRVRLLVDTWGS